MCGSSLGAGAGVREFRVTTENRAPLAAPGDSLVMVCGLVRA